MTEDTPVRAATPQVRMADDFPPAEQLLFWWECLRKHRYATADQAAAVAAGDPTREETVPYVCGYGVPHWHNGRVRTGRNSAARNSTGPSRLRRKWETKLVKPTPDELAAAYAAATAE